VLLKSSLIVQDIKNSLSYKNKNAVFGK